MESDNVSNNFYIFQIEVDNYLITLKSTDGWKAYTYNTYILHIHIHKKAANLHNLQHTITMMTMRSLNNLPREILMKILMDVSYRDVKAVGKTCQRLSSICETILESKRKVMEIRASWSNPNYWPPMEALLSAASLARQGFLTEVKFMNLGCPRQGQKFDLSSIPIVDLVKLSKCVSDGVKCDARGDLSPVLNNINCDFVQFCQKKSLTTAESQALVTAMVSRVKTVKMEACQQTC